MKWKQVLAAGFIGAALLTGSVTAGAFSDTPPAWSAQQLATLQDESLFRGLSTESIASTAPIRRGEFCQLLVNLVQKEMTQERFDAIPPKDASYFDDLSYSAAQYAPGGKYNMYYAAAYGITEGAVKNGRRLADINALLTREQAAKMMCSAIDFLERDVVGGELMAQGTAKTFGDAASISTWAADYVDQASGLGIMEGDERGNFNPAGTITWNEAGVMVSRAFDAAESARLSRLTMEQGCSILLSQSSFDTPTHTYMGSQPLWLSIAEDGSYNVVWEKDGQLQVETFEANWLASGWTSKGVRTLPAELPMFGSFYVGEDGYYAAYGQDNKEENDGKEVYRIVKYDQNWNRVGAASITGGDSYTIQPYDFTANTAMVEEDGTLVLHTARLRYTSTDGLNHQSNFTARIRTSDMSVLETSEVFPDNHVSHSFSQDVIFADGAPVYADLGDAYPRAFAISQASGAQQSVLPFYGATGDNTICASLGGLAASDGYYLLAGASAPQTDAASWRTDRMNALLAVVPKDGFPKGKADIQWLTNFTNGSEWVEDVRLVAVNDNTFVVFWQSTNSDYIAGDLCYAVFDGQGRQTGSTRTLEGRLIPTGNVLFHDGKLCWVRPEGKDLYPYLNGSTSELVLYRVSVDANEATGSADVSFDLTPSTLELMTGGKSEKLTASCSGISGTQPQITYRSSDYAVATVDSEGAVTGRGAGTATITASMTYRGKTYTDTCAVTVTQAPDLTGLKLTPSSATLKLGETLNLTVETVPAGLNPTIVWSYRGSLRATDNLHAIYTAEKAGTDTITISATTPNGRTVTASCTVTVTDGTTTEEQPGTGTGSETQPGTGTGSETKPGTGTGSETKPGTGTGSETKPGTGSSGPSSTEPYDTDYYREDYASGRYLEIRAVDGSTVEISGCLDQSQAYYNYVVAWAPGGNKAEVPYVEGQPFHTTVQVDTASVRKSAQEGKVPYLTVMVCQHYAPGDSSLAGFSFQEVDIGLVPGGDGFLFHVMPR